VRYLLIAVEDKVAEALEAVFAATMPDVEVSELPGGPEPDWVAEIAADAVSWSRNAMMYQMGQHGEDPVDAGQWKLRMGQFQALIGTGRAWPPRKKDDAV